MFLWFTLYLTSRIICTYYRKFFLTESRAAPLFLVPCLASTFHPGGNHSSAPLRGFWAPASISCGFSQPSLTPSPTAVWQRLWLRLCTLFPHPQMGTEPHISQASYKKNPRDVGGGDFNKRTLRNFLFYSNKCEVKHSSCWPVPGQEVVNSCRLFLHLVCISQGSVLLPLFSLVWLSLYSQP